MSKPQKNWNFVSRKDKRKLNIVKQPWEKENSNINEKEIQNGKNYANQIM